MLSAIYDARALVIALFLIVPLNRTGALLFASAMGFLWLGTEPLTSGLVWQMLGIRYLSTLYGIVFLSHQVGSFFGAWAAGLLYDRIGNYDTAWGASLVLGVAAILLHLPIRNAPMVRAQPA